MERQNDLMPLLVALKSEKQAIAYYARAARRINNPTGKEALEKIKKQEEQHYRNLKNKFKKLAGRDLKTGEEDKLPAAISHLTEQHIPDREASDIEVCQIAIKDENDAKNYYLKQAKTAADADTKKLYEELAKEEVYHAGLLKKICKILSD